MKKKMTMRTIVFSIVLVAMTLTANNLNAQDRGLFGRGETETEVANRSGESFTLTNETFGENTSPVGGGLAILIAAGLGYVALKKKED